MNGTVVYPNPFGSGLRSTCWKASPLSESAASATMVSNPAIPNVTLRPCWIRATALSMARPAVEESSGRNGEPVCPTPYTEPCSASRAQRVQDEGVHAEVGALARELERGPRRHADHRHHEAYRQAIGETELA